MKLKGIFLFTITLFTLVACGKEGDTAPTAPESNKPVVKAEPTYEVVIESNIVYAEGLKHESTNSEEATTVSLELDVYTPDNNIENRPAFMFIHGGAFRGGDKKQSQIEAVANYFASRGWVFYSINYRLARDNGTVPQEWADVVSTIEDEAAEQFLAMYPAHRDAKAALRWVVENAETYKINADYVTVGGGSAGAITAITLGISNLEDFRDEINLEQDPTLSSANLEQDYEIKTIINFWGSKVGLDAHTIVYGTQRFDSNDPPMLIVHGTEDPTVPFSSAEELKAIYETNNIPLAYYPIEGGGHGVWGATVGGKGIDDLSFDFIVQQQNLFVE